jgi:hypothetical protein
MTMRKLIVAMVRVAAIVACALDGAVMAQSQPPFGERWQDLPAKPAVPPAQNLPVSVEQAFYLIRSTLLTLNDANRSGNYSVLRDLAAPDFQAKNSAADLADSFPTCAGGNSICLPQHWSRPSSAQHQRSTARACCG